MNLINLTLMFDVNLMMLTLMMLPMFNPKPKKQSSVAFVF